MSTDDIIQLDLFGGDRRPRAAHIWQKEPSGFYVEPTWCSVRLFETETFIGAIEDHCCGIGRIPEAALRAGYKTFASDIIDRGYPHLDTVVDFFQCERRIENLVSNPPFDVCDAFVRHALKLTTRKVAVIWLARRLNAARWLQETPLACVYLPTPRPSMPPGRVILAGEKPGGGTQDFVWLIFSHGHVGPPAMHWLRRDGERS
jgi:hypothetical protein